jgi:hypothetical protein
MAARCRVAVLGLTHFNKQEEAKAVLRFTASVAFIWQARAGWIATPELDAGESQQAASSSQRQEQPRTRHWRLRLPH